MQSLLELQRSFGEALRDSAMAAQLPRGFAVYVGNVRGNWTKALAAAYPIVRKIVGAGFFEGLASDFARAHVSMSGDLNEFGERLPDFLAAGSKTKELPYLPDVATMEWLAHRAYYAANAVPLDPARLAAMDPAEYSRLPIRRAPGSEMQGYNSRLDPLQAAILRVKLLKLDNWNERRRAVSSQYLAGLADFDLVLPYVPAWAQPVWHLFVVQYPHRDLLQKRLSEKDVGTLIHYPIPPHMQQAYRHRAFGMNSLPLAKRMADEVLSLPMGPHLSTTQAKQVIAALLCSVRAND